MAGSSTMSMIEEQAMLQDKNLTAWLDSDNGNRSSVQGRMNNTAAEYEAKLASLTARYNSLLEETAALVRGAEAGRLTEQQIMSRIAQLGSAH